MNVLSPFQSYQYQILVLTISNHRQPSFKVGQSSQSYKETLKGGVLTSVYKFISRKQFFISTLGDHMVNEFTK